MMPVEFESGIKKCRFGSLLHDADAGRILKRPNLLCLFRSLEGKIIALRKAVLVKEA